LAEMGNRLEAVDTGESGSALPLHETEWFRNLIWRDYLSEVAEIKLLLERDTVRLGVIGDPNRSKSLLAWDFFQLATAAGLPVYYRDLDLWSPSLGVFEGRNTWEDRPKRQRGEVTDEEIRKSIDGLSDLGPGLVVADFPGLVDEPSQQDRLRAVDMALLLESDPGEGLKWLRPLVKTRTRFAWMITSPSLGVEEIENAQGGHSLYGVDRKIDKVHVSEVVALTMMLECIGSRGSNPEFGDNLTERELEILIDYRRQFGPIIENSPLEAKIIFSPFAFQLYDCKMWPQTMVHMLGQLSLSLCGRK
jgi:hypothetical protein